MNAKQKEAVKVAAEIKRVAQTAARAIMHRAAVEAILLRKQAAIVAAALVAKAK
jgi:hypothetical protein